MDINQMIQEIWDNANAIQYDIEQYKIKVKLIELKLEYEKLRLDKHYEALLTIDKLTEE